jgi:hypothetical protein
MEGVVTIRLPGLNLLLGKKEKMKKHKITFSLSLRSASFMPKYYFLKKKSARKIPRNRKNQPQYTTILRRCYTG